MPDQGQGGTGDAAGPGGDFLLGDWLIQPSLNRATRNGTTAHLRPQIVDVLVCLARSAGRPVSRREMLDRVWPNQFVVDTALARCVAELRQALGDNAQAPTLIETIPKRGYRLVAPVVPISGDSHGGAVATDLRQAAAPGTTPPDGSEDGPEMAAQPDLMVRHARADGWLRSGRRVRRALAISAVLLVVMAAALISWWLLARRAEPVASPGAQNQVVLTFTNATGDQAFDDSLRLALAIHLERSPYLRVAPESRVREALRVLDRPMTFDVTRDLALQVCGQIGAHAVLRGSIAPLGTRYVIGLEAVACASRATIARAQAEAPGKEGVLGTLSQAADTIRRDLGRSLAAASRLDVPAARPTP